MVHLVIRLFTANSPHWCIAYKLIVIFVLARGYGVSSYFPSLSNPN